jgi:hypothetical protein
VVADPGRSAALLFTPLLFRSAEPGPTLAMCRQLVGRQVVLVLLGPLPAWMPRELMTATTASAITPGHLLRSLRSSACDPAGSWLITEDAAAIPAAGSAGMAGVVLVGRRPPPPESEVWVRSSPDLLSVPINLVPRGGGCWHQA